MNTIILSILLLFANIYNTETLDRYAKAYKYIRDNRANGELFTYYYDSLITTPYKICISDKVYYIEKQTFTDDIIDYEYNKPEGKKRNHIWDSLATIEIMNISRSLEDFIVYPELEKLNECTTECDLELLFSEFDKQGRLRASLIPNRKKYGRYLDLEPKCGIEYLFYFENDDIKKVFYKSFQK